MGYGGLALERDDVYASLAVSVEDLAGSAAVNDDCARRQSPHHDVGHSGKEAEEGSGEVAGG